ncbi:MAG: hypothetical protein U0610_03550 [bacterium]
MSDDPAVPAESRSHAALGRRRLASALAPLLGLLLVCSVHLVVSAQPEWSPRPDAARYLATARSLARGEGYTYLGQPFTLRPPGFSVLLAPMTAFVGLDFRALEIFTGATALVAAAALFLLFRARLGTPLAGALTLWFWFHPERIRLCREIMADVPGFAALAIALLAIEARDRKPSRGRDVAVGVLVAVAAYLRTAHLALLPALALGALRAAPDAGAVRECGDSSDSRAALRRRVAGVVASVAVAAALYGPWLVYSARVGSTAEPGGIDFDSYWQSMSRADPIDTRSGSLGVSGWITRVGENATLYAALVGSDLGSTELSGASLAISAALVAAWLARLAKRRSVLDWVVGIELAELLLYFARQSRLLLPAHVLLVAVALEAVRDLVARVLPLRLGEALLAATLVCVTVGERGPDPAELGKRIAYYDLVRMARYLRTETSARQVVAGDHGAIYGLLADRPVLSLRAMLRRRPEMLGEALARSHIDVLVAERGGALEGFVSAAAERAGAVRDLGHYAVVALEAAAERADVPRGPENP